MGCIKLVNHRLASSGVSSKGEGVDFADDDSHHDGSVPQAIKSDVFICFLLQSAVFNDSAKKA